MRSGIIIGIWLIACLAILGVLLVVFPNDRLFAIVVFGSYLAASYARNGWGIRVITQFYWSVVAILFLVPAVLIALFVGSYSHALKLSFILTLSLTLTGFIPGLILGFRGWTFRGLWYRESSSNAPSPPTSPTTYVTHTQPAVANSCPRCGLTLRRRHGRYGWFVGCSGYPNCRYTKSLS
jgi:Topoisomerase DNA binding C4 zinc finger